MNEKQTKVYELLKEFIEICNKHNLDYCAMYGTALGAIRHNGFIPWDDDIDLLISIETYKFLKENYRNLIVDWETRNSFLMFPKFSKDKDSQKDATFLDLFIDIPTTKKRIKKYLSLKNKLGYLNAYSQRKFFDIQWGMKIAKVLLFWTRMFKKPNYQKALETLYEPNSNIHHVINWPFKKATKINIYENINFFDTIDVKFEDIKIRVPKNYETIFLQNYGPNWRIPKKYKMSEHLGMYDMKVFCKKERAKKNDK
ncbi:diacylglycerol cholinephosphotransferase Mf1 [Mycoplasmopsis fermentans]|nr:LicD family protein [Mycoplasmopsis fermentans]ADN68769.1 hypothetical licD family protein [Mycoplasmopsis fermentans JER]RMX36169.1 licD family protein [Mycoplasmopsis fermentans MF-I2]RMX36213.1 licD family protein [Mycoplasmopsis fermentans MF-I1]